MSNPNLYTRTQDKQKHKRYSKKQSEYGVSFKQEIWVNFDFLHKLQKKRFYNSQS